MVGYSDCLHLHPSHQNQVIKKESAMYLPGCQLSLQVIVCTVSSGVWVSAADVEAWTTQQVFQHISGDFLKRCYCACVPLP